MEYHLKQVAEIAAQVKAHADLGTSRKLRFRHGSTNSTRSREGDYDYIDVGPLDAVLEVNAEQKWVLVEPNVSMEKLVKETLKYNLVPEVVMEFPAITVGGGIQGAGLESSSFRFGQFNDTCITYELITGNGDIITVSRDEHPDLFYGISSTYGTVAVVTAAKVRLIQARRYVQVTYRAYDNVKEAINAISKEVCGVSDFIEGIIFSPQSAVVMVGVFSDSSENLQRFSGAKDPWFYRHAKNIIADRRVYEETVPVMDYLFRYNRGAFWMAEYVFPMFHLPKGAIMRYIMNPVLNAKKLYEYLHVANVTQNYLIQDYYYPFESAIDYIEFNNDKFGIYPIWLCPVMATSTEQKLSPHYSPNSKMLLNVGIYGQSKRFLEKGYVAANRDIEQFAIANKARKMFYAHSYYPKDEFWRVYDHSWYQSLRKKYDSQKIFPEIWEKIFVTKKYKPSIYVTLWIYIYKDIGRKLLSYFRTRASQK